MTWIRGIAKACRGFNLLKALRKRRDEKRIQDGLDLDQVGPFKQCMNCGLRDESGCVLGPYKEDCEMVRKTGS